VPLARAVLALLAGVLVATTAAVGFAGVASAAPPLSLTATPNPVTIPNGQTTGSYDLKWSTGSNLPAEFTFSINGGPESQRLDQTPADSAGPFAINYGQTWTWRLYTKGLVRPLKTVVITTRHPDQSCAGTCIKDVVVTPHGTFADVKVLATAKLKTFELTANEPGQPVSSAMIGWDTQTWNTQLLSLDPGTTYEFALKVTDESGNSQTRFGTFTTLKRQVTVTFDAITVTDDSDDLSEGDLTFWFDAGEGWDTGNTFSAGVDTGDTVHPGWSTVVSGGPDLLELGLHGHDDDCGPFTLCSMGSMPSASTTGGSNSEADWATAHHTINTLVSGPGESFSGPFSLATSAYALKFSGSGTFSVTYS
jgi:hypothetical protein